MRGSKLVTFMLLCSLSAVMIVACGTESSTVEATAAVATPTTPPGVERARTAVLDLLRQGANECVPPAIAGWSEPDVEAAVPAGYIVHRFQSDSCAITVTVAEGQLDTGPYHVALGEGASGFCWQAIVDDQGVVLKTGVEAQTDPILGNPAKAFCEAQGYTFEIVTLSSGTRCGKCVFPNGNACNAWAYFHGLCTLENALPLDS